MFRTPNGQRRTLYDLAWPSHEQDYADLAQRWGDDAVEMMMSVSWRGYEELVRTYFSRVDFTQADEELERTITQLLEPCIRQFLSGDEPYYVQHGCYEYATRAPAPAQPPQYDIAFVLIQNGRIMWPVEAKVLRTDARISRYVRDVKCEFLTGRYAPFTNGGAMFGYLFSGTSKSALDNIASRLGCPLVPFRGFDCNRHLVSEHYRRLLERKHSKAGALDVVR